MTGKLDCYTCVHRGTIPGDAHSCCKHPALGDAVNGDLIANMMAIFAGVGRVDPVILTGKLGIVANKVGVQHGWFNWPWNFDPVWLVNCDGFKGKEP